MHRLCRSQLVGELFPADRRARQQAGSYKGRRWSPASWFLQQRWRLLASGPMHPWLRTALLVLGFVWALPMTLLGLLGGLLLMPFGARPRFEHMSLVFHHVPVGPGGALTIGNVILHT